MLHEDYYLRLSHYLLLPVKMQQMREHKISKWSYCFYLGEKWKQAASAILVLDVRGKVKYAFRNSPAKLSVLLFQMQ